MVALTSPGDLIACLLVVWCVHLTAKLSPFQTSDLAVIELVVISFIRQAGERIYNTV